MKSLLLGSFLLSGYVGFLVGASATPVAGAVIGSLIGLAAAAAPLLPGLFAPKPSDATPTEKAPSVPSLGHLGAVLIVVSLGLGVGTLGGFYFKVREMLPVDVPGFQSSTDRRFRPAIIDDVRHSAPTTPVPAF